MPLFCRPGAGAVGEICGGSLTRIRRHRPPLSYSQHHHTLCTHIHHAYMHTCKHTKQISIMHCMFPRGRMCGCYSRLRRFCRPSEGAGRWRWRWSSLRCFSITEYSLKRGLMWIQRSALHPIIWQKFSVKYWLKRFARDLMWIQHLALHLVIMTKIFSVVTLTQNAIKGVWKAWEGATQEKTSLYHPKLYLMFAINNDMI